MNARYLVKIEESQSRVDFREKKKFPILPGTVDEAIIDVTAMSEASLHDNAMLQALRKKQGLSQRVLARQCGISRGRIRRLEQEGFENATLGELQRISASLGLGVRDLLKNEASLNLGPHVCRFGESTFRLEGGSNGHKITSFHPHGLGLFTGKLFISPKRRLAQEETPRAQTIFLLMLLGCLLIEIEGTTHQIDEGDSILFEGNRNYGIENPLSRDSTALLLTVPSCTF